MPPRFPFDCHDNILAQRMSRSEWERIVAFRKEPRILEALFAYARIMPEFFSHKTILNKIVVEDWKFYILAFAL